MIHVIILTSLMEGSKLFVLKYVPFYSITPGRLSIVFTF